MNQRGPLGKPLGGADLPPREKWDYDKFVAKITILESEIASLKIGLRDLEVDCAQYRIALCQAQAALYKALTSNPFPWDEQMQKAWESGAKEVRLAQAKAAHRINERRANRV